MNRVVANQGPASGRGSALILVLVLAAATAAPPPTADTWLQGQPIFPSFIPGHHPSTNGFESLRAEVIADKLVVLCDNLPAEGFSAEVFASQDKPGHWPARDWHGFTMSRAGTNWNASVPVEDLDIPMIYFVSSASGAVTNVSAMRICFPRDAGMDLPSRIFWPFVEGFESGIESWTLLGATIDTPALTVSPQSKSGKAALLVRPAPGKRKSITIATTRLRGARLVSLRASGVSLWLRTVAGQARTRFTFYANAFTTNQMAVTWPVEPDLSPTWREIRLHFDAFAGLPLAGVDYLAIELIPEDASGFLLDDLQLLGPWRTD